ncbi:MAG: glycosyltransferase family 4 protein [Acidobacteria bacterium]|nr:glycosyltransferase family 4 protein [Acidobacteriota bacterium]MBU1338372.1 glycosyltransferase family 4 protein [Acidobacteriota bacterium]MBU1474990.1 glycosyltransferase family 4 protein [Acidobacteriota bacterium]MBU2438677.1 glycosyltransferase family 4 protein [Acidobacteriota bacterium]
MSLFQIDAGKEWRGGQRQSLLLCRELQKRGFSSCFVVQPGSPLHLKAQEENLPVFPLRMRSEADMLAVTKLSLLMKRKKCRLVHFHDAHAVSVGSAAASLAGVPLRVLTRRVDFPLRDNALSRRKYTRGIDRVIALSEGIKKVLVEGGIDPRIIQIIPSGIDFGPYGTPGSSDYLRKELGFSRNDYLVGIVAHLADHKGHKYLIKATSIIKEKAPRIKVIIVGDGPLKMELTRQVAANGVVDMVFFLGFREDIPQILSSLDQFVLSSHLEGMGSSLLDAMASRLPIVATRVGGIPDVITHEETGLLVPSKNPEKLAAAILRLMEDGDLSARLGEEGYRTVHRKYSAEAMAGKVISLYERLAKTKGVKLLD